MLKRAQSARLLHCYSRTMDCWNEIGNCKMLVITALVAVIHRDASGMLTLAQGAHVCKTVTSKEWIAGTSPAMITLLLSSPHLSR
jgi:hypothetical protein